MNIGSCLLFSHFQKHKDPRKVVAALFQATVNLRVPSFLSFPEHFYFKTVRREINSSVVSRSFENTFHPEEQNILKTHKDLSFPFATSVAQLNSHPRFRHILHILGVRRKSNRKELTVP